MNQRITALHLEPHFDQLYRRARDGLDDPREAPDEGHVEVGGWRGRRLTVRRAQHLYELDGAAVDAKETAVDDADGKQRERHSLEHSARLWQEKRTSQ